MKVEVTKKYRHGKTYISGELKGAGVYDSDPDLEVDAIVYPHTGRTLLMLTGWCAALIPCTNRHRKSRNW